MRQFTLNKRVKIILTLFFLIILIFLYLFLREDSRYKIVNTKEFISLLESSPKKDLFIKDSYLYLKTKDKKIKVNINYIPKEKLDNIYYNYPIKKRENFIYPFFVAIVFLIIGYFLYLLYKNQRAAKLEYERLSPPKDIEQNPQPLYKKPLISFNDIAGIDEIKEELEEIIDFLKHPTKYQKLDIKMPKGILLVGPPGVGKTLLAKALAAEAQVPFFYQSGASFAQIYVGAGAKRVKELFNEAKKVAPSIIFIDEIDAVGKSRSEFRNDEREATLNQLLVEMDGFEENSGVIVIGATNRVDVLDEALLRAGRFDRHLYIQLPDNEERKKIISYYLKNKKYKLDIDEVSKMTVGFSSAAIATLINEAALYALRKGRIEILMEDIEAIKDRVLYGNKKVKLLSKKEREIEASYKGAKALCAYWLGENFNKVSLIGEFSIHKDRVFLSKKELLNEIKILLAGYIANLNRFNDVFDISKEDINRAKSLIDEIVKNFQLDYSISEKDKILKEAMEETKGILDRFDNILKNIEKTLLEKEHMSYKEIKDLFDGIF